MQNGRRKGNSGGGAMTAQGRRSQIAHKLNHGIRGISPVLLDIERQADWESHYKGITRSLAPGDAYEANLVHKIAWQLWRLDRLIRHETALTITKTHQPPESVLDSLSRPTLTKEAILDAMARLEGENRNENSRNGEGSGNSLLSRCRALQSATPDGMFDPSEVREIFTLVLEQVRSSKARIDEEGDEEELKGNDDTQEEELTIEDRPWPAGEVAEQLRNLSDAANLDWREELAGAIQSLQEAEDEHTRQMEEARRHVLRNLILGERTVNRLSLYERQVMSQLKATYSLLERARAWRLGMPVPPPVSVDLTVSQGSDANGV